MRNLVMFSKCRACLRSKDDMKYLFTTTSEVKNIISMFTSVTKFEWIENDTVAPYLCKECETLLESSFQFQKKCQGSHNLIEEFLKAEGTKTEEKRQFLNETPLEINEISDNGDNFGIKCDKSLTNSSNGVENTEMGKICEICNKKFKLNKNLQAHLKLHKGDTPYKCSFCGKGLKSKASLTDHERTHTGEKPFTCNVCGKGFSQSGSLETHMRQHTGRPEQCQICEKRFCRPSELKRHLSKHAGDRPHLCTLCGKAFMQRSHLIEHGRIHSELKPHKCDLCQKGFKRKSWLKLHIKTHTGQKDFKCTECSYASNRKYRLEQHLKLHRGNQRKIQKNHVCPICQKSYENLALLNCHKSTSHNVIL